MAAESSISIPMAMRRLPLFLRRCLFLLLITAFAAGVFKGTGCHQYSAANQQDRYRPPKLASLRKRRICRLFRFFRGRTGWAGSLLRRAGRAYRFRRLGRRFFRSLRRGFVRASASAGVGIGDNEKGIANLFDRGSVSIRNVIFNDFPIVVDIGNDPAEPPSVFSRQRPRPIKGTIPIEAYGNLVRTGRTVIADPVLTTVMEVEGSSPPPPVSPSI